MAPRTGRTAGEVEAHACMHAKGVPQLLGSVIKEMLVERPDDAVGFMRDMLRKASAGLDGGGVEDGKEAAGDEAAAAGAGSRAKSAGSLRVHAEFRDASGASTQTHVHRVSAARCGRATLLGWCDEAHEALRELVGVASEPGGGVRPDKRQRKTEGRVSVLRCLFLRATSDNPAPASTHPALGPYAITPNTVEQIYTLGGTSGPLVSSSSQHRRTPEIVL